MISQRTYNFIGLFLFVLCVVLGKGVSLSLYYCAVLPQGKTGLGQDKLIFVWTVPLSLSPSITFEVPVLYDQEACDAESQSALLPSAQLCTTQTVLGIMEILSDQ